MSPPDAHTDENSPPRRALYEAGEYDPQEYLMIWPRRAMLALSRDGATEC